MWDGKHVQVQYHSDLVASSAHLVEADIEWDRVGTRRIPVMYLRGKYNDWVSPLLFRKLPGRLWMLAGRREADAIGPSRVMTTDCRTSLCAIRSEAGRLTS